VKSPAIHLRPYRPSDFETLFRIDQTCFPRGIAYGSAEMKHYLQAPGSFCLIAEVVGAIGGFIVTELSAEIGHVITLDVPESYRRQGIGSRLLESAEQASATQGARLMYLETATTNKAAIALWKKHGYRESGSRMKNYYGPGLDAFHMHKLLPSKSHVKVSP
jgi:[ribosomal protein S18]-alanine N-acetyltransferase